MIYYLVSNTVYKELHCLPRLFIFVILKDEEILEILLCMHKSNDV